MRRQLRWGSSLATFLIFFAMMSFLALCFGMLFISLLQQEYHLVLDEAHMKRVGILGMVNVLALSLVAAVIDRWRRGIYVDRPVRRILEATERITAGNLNVRAEPLGTGADIYGFDAIIQNLNKMAKELGSIETLRTDFVSNVSHELKTPLAIISNYATILQSDTLTEAERQEYTRAIARASKNLAELVSNILKLSKLENQQIFPETQEFDLAEQLRESLLSFEEIWERKELVLEVALPETMRIRSDPELWGLVWNNLLSNAMKFTPQGGTVSLSLTREEGTAVVCIRDTGCGIRASQGKHIFEKFYQTDPAHAARGNGLGLALVKRVVDITGSAITVQSAPGKGSSFTVRIAHQKGETNGRSL